MLIKLSLESYSLASEEKEELYNLHGTEELRHQAKV